MSELDYDKSTNQNLLLIISHEDVFDNNIFTAALQEWDKRNLNELETDFLINAQEQTIQKCRDLISDKNNTEKIKSILMANGINEESSQIFIKSLKSSNKSIVGGVIIIIILIKIVSIIS